MVGVGGGWDDMSMTQPKRQILGASVAALESISKNLLKQIIMPHSDATNEPFG